MKKKMKKQDITICLTDAGCQLDMIQQFLEKEDQDERLILLKKQKCCLLEKLHMIQKQIDCLDYFIYTLKQENQE